MWMNLKIIMISERNQMQLYEVSRIGKSIHSKQTGGCQGLGEGRAQGVTG